MHFKAITTYFLPIYSMDLFQKRRCDH